MIDLAKNSVARHMIHPTDKSLETEQQVDDEPGSDKVKCPPMLIMACNIMEVQRLREELISSVHETAILAKVYAQ
jgi:hypothetical protein